VRIVLKRRKAEESRRTHEAAALGSRGWVRRDLHGIVPVNGLARASRVFRRGNGSSSHQRQKRKKTVRRGPW